MTFRTLRQIAKQSGIEHAEYCLSQDQTSTPRQREKLMAELSRLLWERGQ
jgi:hypothetical protein